ncbi:MAG: hypothetical protein K2O01_01390 [Bacteroidales bacterium]|nr:hypothetical protein [Bacteroidales bacterium]
MGKIDGESRRTDRSADGRPPYRVTGRPARWRKQASLCLLFAAVTVFGLPQPAAAQKKADRVPAKRPAASAAGTPADQVAGGDRVLAFVKGASRRTLYKEGAVLKIKTVDNRKVQGYINRIGDTAVMINGIDYRYDRIAAYYVPFRICTLMGSALCIAGGGYLLLDGINGAINRRQPVFHVEALSAGIPLAAAGGVVLAFKEVRRSTDKWRVKVMVW